MSIPYSDRFGDIYFSDGDGLAEARHVFLAGNGLPGRWTDRRDFTIGETGFGTGLNFLAAWIAFEATAPPDATLDYIGVELYPLSADQIKNFLERWADEFDGRLTRLAAQYPLIVPGFHRLHLGRVRLTLIFDDVRKAMEDLVAPHGIDAWFLDGFAPAKNPAMWEPPLYAGMARLSAPGATVATFTAAGAVRRGLKDAGFDVEKIAGFGRKRDMTVARFPPGPAVRRDCPARITIQGGGLAGTACAFALRRRGLKPVLFERADRLASGASGNGLGLCNPRFTARRQPQSDYFTAAYALAQRVFPALHGIDPDGRGSLHLVNTPERRKRFEGLLAAWGWPQEDMRLLDSTAASATAGVAIGDACLWLPQSGSVDPSALCRAYAADIEIIHGMAGAKTQDFDCTILAQGAAMPALFPGHLHTVRGQVSWARPRADAPALRANLCYGGYLSAAMRDGAHMLGSSFQKWLDHTDLLKEDDRANLDRLETNIPSLAGLYGVGPARAALRTVSRDHFPLCGRLRAGAYVSTAHGSHGILSSLISAELIADMIDGSPRCLPRDTVAALDPARFAPAHDGALSPAGLVL